MPDPSLADLFESFAQQCPPPPPRPSYPAGFKLVLEPSPDELHIELLFGWSPTSGEVCAQVSQFDIDATGTVSSTIVNAEPPDCIPVPEPGVTSMLLVGVLVIAGMARGRRGRAGSLRC